MQMTAGSVALRKAHRQGWCIVALLFGIAILVSVISAGLGAVSVHPALVVRIVGHHLFAVPQTQDWPNSVDAIVWIARLPRVLMAAAVGATLAACGAALQAIVRNPLAEPYVLGISSGASTGAALAILTPLAAIGGAFALSGFAFGGAVIATVLVLYLGGGGRLNPYRLILAGMAVGYAMSSVTSFLIFASDSPEAGRSVMFWLMGSLAAIHWQTVILSLGVALVSVAALTLASGHLDALAEGDDTAIALGVDPARTRFKLLIFISFAVGVMVAGAGVIGFVGLVVPHLARGLVGPRHWLLIPASACIGASFLSIADIAARLLFAPREMAIGVVTGVVGTPLLLIMMRRMARRFEL